MLQTSYTYIVASRRHGTLYTGVTSDLIRRIHQHQHHLAEGFASRYDVTRLVWYMQSEDIPAAIALEKKIKNRGRKWKIALIEKGNPDWKDLAVDWTSGAGDSAQDEDARMQNRDSVPRAETARMSSPTFHLADPVADRAALLALNVEYVTWVFAEIEKISGMTARSILGSEVADYVPTVIDKVCGDPPPRGVFYLVEDGGELLAMGGLRRSGEGIAELKRVYVRPAGRGHGLGEAIARRLVEDAREFGYRTVRLDTLPFMQRAQALYESMGFVDCAPYPVEMPEAFRDRIRYMALAL